ncbi:MAG: phycobilisome protein [Cyanobacteria bacterium P01_A01_bin.45]
MAQLSQKVQELITKARIVSFAQWNATHPEEAIQLFQTADDQGTYLTKEDLQQLRKLAPKSTDFFDVVQLFADSTDNSTETTITNNLITDIVNEAREQLLAKYPDITQPGGGLYPPVRAEACWRDFWHFLRCISYGIAGKHVQYTSEQGLYYMELLYQELQVPLDAMIVGLEGIKDATLKRVKVDKRDSLSPYFDHLIEKLSEFKE